MLIVPYVLQMGWIEAPLYFCTVSETARYVGTDYIETAVGALMEHKFLPLATGDSDYNKLPASAEGEDFKYILECFVDDFIGLAIPRAQSHLDQVADGTMYDIHDVFPEKQGRTRTTPLQKQRREGGTQRGCSKTMS